MYELFADILSQILFYLIRLVRLLRKSIKTNCVRLFGFAKYALPRVIADICLTNSTRYQSLASIKVFIIIPALRQAWTSLKVSAMTNGSLPIEFLYKRRFSPFTACEYLRCEKNAAFVGSTKAAVGLPSVTITICFIS